MSFDDPAVLSDRPKAGGSVRVRVARTALKAALGTPGVVGSDRGPNGLCVTADPPAGLLVGVSATAQADGRYAVDLSLVADMVPLVELAERVRERTQTRARGEQLDDVLGSLNVAFACVMTADELARAAAEKEGAETHATEELPRAATGTEQAGSPTVREPIPAEHGVTEGATANGSTGPDLPALALQQAALAADQAALAAKQAALAEQAALAVAPGAAAPRLSHEHVTEEPKS